MRFKLTALFSAFLLALVIALPTQAQVKLTDLNFQNKPVEPGAGLAMTSISTLIGPQSGSAALGDGVIVFKFRLDDIDPIADDNSDVTVSCILIQNLGTATNTDIAQVMVLDQDSNAVAPPLPPAAAGAAAPPAGCNAMATTSPNAQVAWEAFFDVAAADLGNPALHASVIPDDGTDTFQVAVRVSHINDIATGDLFDDSQNHTLVLRATFQLTETVGSPPVATTFVDPVTDGAPEVIWNGGINSFTQDTYVVDPLMPGQTGTVSRFTICDNDADEDQLILDRFFVRQDELGTALSSDIVSLDLYRIEGFTRTLVASRTPDVTFERGSGTAGGLAFPGGASTAITVPDDTCMTFDLEAQVSPFAFKGHTISPRISVSAQEPFGSSISSTVEPEIRTNVPTLIGKGLLVLPDTRLIGKPGIIPVNVSGVALPGLGTLQIGPNGRLKYDPRVFSITDIVGVAPYLVSATEIDNRRGEARFTVQIDPNFDGNGDGLPDNSLLTGLQDGTIAQLLVTPTGLPGDRTRLVLTFDCFELVNQNNCIPTGFPNTNVPNQNPNNDISVSGGEVTILFPGDVDLDGTPTIRDSLLLANAILACTFGTTQTSSVTIGNGFNTTQESVVWTSGLNVLISTNTLSKNAGSSTLFDAGAISTQSLLSGNGFVETTVSETTTDRLFGLSRGNTDQSDTDIDFAIFLKLNGTLEVRQNGTQLLPSPAISYALNDVLRVEVNGNDVLYKKNGITFLTSTGVISSASYPLLVDTSFRQINATLGNVQVRSLSTTTTTGGTASLITSLTPEQRSVADVAAPFASINVVPGCTELTSADVAEIARLAINFGTTPAPLPIGAAFVPQATHKTTWTSFFSNAWQWLTGTQAGYDAASVRVGFNSAAHTMDVAINDVPGSALGGLQGSITFDPSSVQVHALSGINGYSVLASQIDNVTGSVRFIALAPKGQGVHNGQLVRLNVTTRGDVIAPSLSVEALIDEDAANVPYALAQQRRFAAQTLSLNKVQALSVGDGVLRFQALGTGISSVQVQIYDLAGGKLLDQQAQGNSLSFNGLSVSGQPLANGVYLYVITAKGAQGDTLRSSVNKLVILR